MRQLRVMAICAGLALAACWFFPSDLRAQPPGDPHFKSPHKAAPQKAAPQGQPHRQMTPQRPQTQRVAPQAQQPKAVAPVRPSTQRMTPQVTPPAQRMAPPSHPQRAVVTPPPARHAPPSPPRRHLPPVWAAAVPLLALPPLYYAATPPPPPPPPPYGTEMVVAYTDNLKVRNCPGNQCQVVGALQRGTVVTLLEYRSRFALVRVAGTAYEGWVNYKYLAPIP